MAVNTKENAKLHEMGSCSAMSLTSIIFAPPLISPGRMKVETLNLAHAWMADSSNEKVQNMSERVMWCHVTHILNFRPPNISATAKATKFP